MQSDIKTLGIVLKRTNYGEADRILNLITPEGKISAIAKGVRRARSKLAGGVEMFSLSELNIHQGKSELGVVTSAKMLKYYNKLLADYSKMELAATILKKVSLAAESSDSSDYFKLTDESLSGLNDGVNAKLVESWFLLNLVRAMGEEINLHRDINGEKLDAVRRYAWDSVEKSFVAREMGDYGANEIKMLRLMLTTDLAVVARVNGYEPMSSRIWAVVQTYQV